MVTDGHQRPEIPPEAACPSPSFPGMGKYVELMNNCWKQVRVLLGALLLWVHRLHIAGGYCLFWLIPLPFHQAYLISR